jgi:crossover junction endodeoxyribonuclease RuvC
MSSAPPPVIAVGLDLSLTAAGIATPRGVFTEGEDGHNGATLTQRRERISRQTSRVLDRVLGDPFTGLAIDGTPEPGPLVVAIEAPTPSRIVGHQHDRSGLWWRVVTELSSWPEVYVVEVGSASRQLYATGKGRASKVAVASEASLRYGVAFSSDDEADAFVLRAMVLDHYGAPLASVPARNRKALDAVAWPVLPVWEVAAR